MLSAEEPAGAGDLYGEVGLFGNCAAIFVGSFDTSAEFCDGLVASWIKQEQADGNGRISKADTAAGVRIQYHQ